MLADVYISLATEAPAALLSSEPVYLLLFA